MNSATITRRRPADNPFASHRIEGLAFRATGLELARLCRRLETLRGRSAIVGPKGSRRKRSLLGKWVMRSSLARIDAPRCLVAPSSREAILTGSPMTV